MEKTAEKIDVAVEEAEKGASATAEPAKVEEAAQPPKPWQSQLLVRSFLLNEKHQFVIV